MTLLKILLWMQLKSIWVIGKAVAAMKKKNVKYPYGKAVKVCEDCCTVDAGNIRKCRVCGGKMIKIEGIVYYGYKID